ncbi:MAG: hypothetical protein AB7E81_08740 [Hyphomicrobiaceae bacterium]
MKTLAASLIAVALLSGAAQARVADQYFSDLNDSAPRSVFDDLNDSAPRSLFDDLNESAPRSTFDDLRDSAPRAATGSETGGRDFVGE